MATELHVHPALQKVTIVFTDRRYEDFYGLENLKKLRTAGNDAMHGAPDCEVDLTDGNRHTVTVTVQSGARLSNF